MVYRLGSRARGGRGAAGLSLLTVRRMLSCLVLLVHFGGVAQAESPGKEPATNRPWSATIAPANEPGERLVVTGRVFASDGKTPLEGIEVYVYHTDTAGLYNVDSRNSSDPRLKTRLWTNKDGRYEFSTIKPGPYPQGGAAAHIHFVLAAPDVEKHSFEIFFAGDRFLDAETRRRADVGSVCKIVEPEKHADGLLHATCDIVYGAVSRGATTR